MITEEQRRALHALREALRLCEGADVHVVAWKGIATVGIGELPEGSHELCSSTVSLRLQEYPES